MPFYLVIFLFDFAKLLAAARNFDFRLMRNPGITASNASSFEDCINQCQSTTGCSAVSYSMGKKVCLSSLCNQLDLVVNRGWRTYVLFDDSLLEQDPNLPLPNVEWMLTDKCSLSNLGPVDGPAINTIGSSYLPSMSDYIGNAVRFSGSSTSYGSSVANTMVNNPMGTSSFSLCAWIKWSVTNTNHALFEFSTGTSTRGIWIWLYGGIMFDFGKSYGTDYSQNTYRSVASFTPVSNTWNHISFVYDGTNKLVKVYVNYTLISATSITSVKNTITWNTFWIGHSNFDPNFNFNGQMACVKLYNTAVDSIQITSIGNSCMQGKIRFS